MSANEREIQCRQCRERVPLATENCPHCGASIRDRTRSLLAVVFGLVVALASLTDLGRLWFYGVLGGGIAATGVYLLYDRRRRIRSG